MKLLTKLALAVAVMSMPMISFASPACEKCCKDNGKTCASCCKEKGKKCGTDCCKGETAAVATDSKAKN